MINSEILNGYYSVLSLCSLFSNFALIKMNDYYLIWNTNLAKSVT